MKTPEQTQLLQITQIITTSKTIGRLEKELEILNQELTTLQERKTRLENQIRLLEKEISPHLISSHQEEPTVTENTSEQNQGEAISYQQQQTNDQETQPWSKEDQEKTEGQQTEGHISQEKPRNRPGRPPEKQTIKDLILKILEQHPEGLSGDELAKELGKDISRIYVWWSTTGKKLPEITRHNKKFYLTTIWEQTNNQSTPTDPTPEKGTTIPVEGTPISEE